MTYYRLKQTDKNGQSTTSAIKSIYYRNDENLNFNIVPNPAGENGFSLFFNQVSEVKGRFTVKDIMCKIILQKLIDMNSSEYQVTDQLESGIYFVEVQGDGAAITQKLIIK